MGDYANNSPHRDAASRNLFIIVFISTLASLYAIETCAKYYARLQIVEIERGEINRKKKIIRVTMFLSLIYAQVKLLDNGIRMNSDRDAISSSSLPHRTHITTNINLILK